MQEQKNNFFWQAFSKFEESINSELRNPALLSIHSQKTQCLMLQCFIVQHLSIFLTVNVSQDHQENIDSLKHCSNVKELYRHESTCSIEAPDKLLDKEHREGEHAIRVSNVFTAIVSIAVHNPKCYVECVQFTLTSS